MILGGTISSPSGDITETDWLAAYVDAEDARFKAHWLAKHLEQSMKVRRIVDPFKGIPGATKTTVWAIYPV